MPDRRPIAARPAAALASRAETESPGGGENAHGDRVHEAMARIATKRASLMQRLAEGVEPRVR
jgi:hypothetical protein